MFYSILALIFITVYGCGGELSKEDIFSPITPTASQIKVPTNFDFRTTKDIQIIKTLRTSSGNNVPNVRVKLFTEKDGKYIASAMSDSSGTVRFTLPISINQESVYLEYNYIGLPEGEYYIVN